jgi:hypothetical protein
MSTSVGRSRRPGFDQRIDGDLVTAVESGGVSVGKLIDELIARLVDARTARVELRSEPADDGVGEFHRVMVGLVNFVEGWARLEMTEPATSVGSVRVMQGHAMYERHQRAASWTTLREANGDDSALTDGGFGLLELLRGADELLGVQPTDTGSLFTVRTDWALALYDDGSASDVFRVPTRLLGAPVIGTIEVNPAGLVSHVELASEGRSRLKVARIRFVLELSDHGLEVEMTVPQSSEVVPKRRTGRLRRIADLIGYPETR